MNRPRRHVILLAGPTASGKSGRALAWARRTGGAVVNADAMQIYRDLRILTARPSVADEAAASHHLYGHRDGAEACSVALWIEDVAALLARQPKDRPLLFVGGTGLYFEALSGGLSPVPPVPESVRERWRARGAERNVADLHAELARIDPAMAARLRPPDRQRVLRALEVMEATGRSLLAWQQERGPSLLGDVRSFVLVPERGDLRMRIADRFMTMIDEGALDEVAALMARQLDPALPVMKAIGVPPLAAHLRGETNLAAAVTTAITQSRQYAKRQQTWLRNRLASWEVLGNSGAGGEIPLS